MRLVLTSAILALFLSPIRWGSQEPASPVFREVASGLETFRLISGTEEKKYIVEANSAGVCVIDFNSDDLPDLFFVNGGELDAFRQKTVSPVRHALFRNQGNRVFAEVTAEAGAGGRGHWGMGCSVADYNADGRPDLYVTTYGPNLLLKNLGNGRFEEVGAATGVDDQRWSTGSAWGDADGDGDVDLFVANYIDLDRSNLPEPGSPGYGSMGSLRLGCQYLGLPVMCGPRGLKGAGDALFLNRGDGTFEEASERFGVHDPDGHYGLAAVWSDLDGDGRLDLYVANDSTPNLLYRNTGGAPFEELGLLSGVAFSAQGTEQAGMGIAVGDYLNEGRQALYVTNFSEEYNTLYRNEGEFNFTDVTARAGLRRPSLPYVGWGTLFLDFDNDGWLDLFVANGHVFPSVDTLDRATLGHYRQRSLLFHNLANGRFADVSSRLEELRPQSSRGAAAADFDSDGKLDVVLNNIDGTPAVLWNNSSDSHHFLRIRLVGPDSNPLAIGSRLRLRTGEIWQMREVHSGSSYSSQNELVVHFGLGTARKADELEIRWPDLTFAKHFEVSADRQITIHYRPGETATPRSDQP